MLKSKNAGHNMAIVGEPYNVDAHAKIPGLFLNMLLSRLCLKMLSFLHTRTCVMPRTFLPSREILFPVQTADRISGLGSVVLWLSR